jgi:hypothetical protein
MPDEAPVTMAKGRVKAEVLIGELFIGITPCERLAGAHGGETVHGDSSLSWSSPLRSGAAG